MATATLSRSVRLSFTFEGKALYVTPKGGIKIGSKGKPQAASDVLAVFEKGEARKLRKALRAAGFPSLAASPRGSYWC